MMENFFNPFSIELALVAKVERAFSFSQSSLLKVDALDKQTRKGPLPGVESDKK